MDHQNHPKIRINFVSYTIYCRPINYFSFRLSVKIWSYKNKCYLSLYQFTSGYSNYGKHIYFSYIILVSFLPSGHEEN